MTSQLAFLYAIPRWIWRTLIILLVVAALYEWFPEITDDLAERMFGSASPAADFEPAYTAWEPRWSSAEWAGIAGRGEGLDCSIPQVALAAFANRHNGVAQSSVNLRFRQACVAHDLCYRHGRATYGYTQSQCDAMLVSSAFRICRQMYSDINWCAVQARKVLAGVTLGGSAAFRRGGAELEAASSSHAGGASSTVAEYDAYPNGAAAYAVPRLITGNCFGRTNVPLLFIFRHRPGGSSFTTRCFNGRSFVRVDRRGMPSPDGADSRNLIFSEYRRMVGPPWIFDAAGPASLLQWCRVFQSGQGTGGTFMLHSDALSFAGCPVGNGDEQDPDVVTIFPVPGPLGTSISAVGLSRGRLRYVPLLATEASSCGSSRSRACVQLEDTCDNVVARDYYRWSAIPPAIVDVSSRRPDGTAVPAALVTIFGRGCGQAADFQRLVSRSVILMSDGYHAVGAQPADGMPRLSEPAYWQLPETAEPFVPALDSHGRISLFSVHSVRQSNTEARQNLGLAIKVLAGLLFLVASVTFLRLTQRGVRVAARLLLASGLCLCFAYLTTMGMSADGFTEDAEISVYRPGPAGNIPTPLTTPIPGGRAWLQQRMSVVRQGDDYFVFMPLFGLLPDCANSGALCLDLRIARVRANGEVKLYRQSGIRLPGWATREALSRLFTLPFRDEAGRLRLLVFDLADHQVVLEPARGSGEFRIISDTAV